MGAHRVWELVCDADGCARNLIADDPGDEPSAVADAAGWSLLEDGRALCHDHAAQHRTGRPLAPVGYDPARDGF